MNKHIGLSIVIPVYNEENAVLDTIENINEIMSSNSGIEYEIIVVDDGSRDNTTQILKEASLDFRLIEHEQNKGYGGALKTGIRESKYDTISITDADGTYPNEEIPKMFEEMKHYDMVVGQRSFKKLSHITKPAKWFINILANFLVGMKIPDLNSGLRIFKKNIAKKYFPIICNGFSFTTTITLAMLTNNMKIKYIPIDYRKRKGKSKIRPIRDTLNFIQLIIRTVMYFNPLKIFVPISLILLFLSLCVFLYSALALPKILDTTVVILFVSSIQMFAIGMIADLIDKRMDL